MVNKQCLRQPVVRSEARQGTDGVRAQGWGGHSVCQSALLSREQGTGAVLSGSLAELELR